MVAIKGRARGYMCVICTVSKEEPGNERIIPCVWGKSKVGEPLPPSPPPPLASSTSLCIQTCCHYTLIHSLPKLSLYLLFYLFTQIFPNSATNSYIRQKRIKPKRKNIKSSVTLVYLFKWCVWNWWKWIRCPIPLLIDPHISPFPYISFLP